MITVMDQHMAWLTPSKTLATSNQNQWLAKMMIKGTGSPISHPSTRSSLTSPCSCAQIGASYLGGFRRWRLYVLSHVAHELVFVVNLERLVELALEANRGHRLTAQGSPTNRARIGSRQDFQIVRQ